MARQTPFVVTASWAVFSVFALAGCGDPTDEASTESVPTPASTTASTTESTTASTTASITESTTASTTEPTEPRTQSSDVSSPIEATEPTEPADTTPTPSSEPTESTTTSGDTTPDPPQETIMAPPLPDDVVNSSLVQLAIADLRDRLGDPSADITVVSVDEVDWPDGSIGCPQPDMSYTQAIVNGSRIVLSFDGVDYGYHQGGGRAPFYCPPDRTSG